MPPAGVKKLSVLSYSRYGISPPILELPAPSRSVTPGMVLPGLNVISDATKAYRSPAKKSLPAIRAAISGGKARPDLDVAGDLGCLRVVP